MARGNIGFFGAAAFLVGIFAASFGISVSLLLGIGALAILICAHFRKILSSRAERGDRTAVPFLPRCCSRLKDHSLLALTFLLPFLIGFFYFYLYLNIRATQEIIPFGEHIAFSGLVVAEPKSSETAQTLTVRLSAPYAGTIRMLVPLVPAYRYGDVLEAEGVVKPRMHSGDVPLAAFPKIAARTTGGGSALVTALINFKHGLVLSFQQFLPRDAGALMAGLTFGSRSDFSKDFKEAMSASGTTHLVALSGYNVAIITIALSGFLRKWMRRRRAFFLTLGMLALFILMVGGEASVVRAAIMGFLLLLAREVGRGYSIRNAIVLAAALMVVFDPTMLRWNIGFQLSFLSLLGIVYVEPAITHFSKKTAGAWFGVFVEGFRMTLAAQLAVLPLLMASFGSFSPVSLIANMVILPFVPLTMFLGFIMAGASMVFPLLAAIIAWGANVLLSYEVFVIRAGAHVAIPISGSSSVLFSIVYVSALIVFAVWGYERKHRT